MYNHQRILQSQSFLYVLIFFSRDIFLTVEFPTFFLSLRLYIFALKLKKKKKPKQNKKTMVGDLNGYVHSELGWIMINRERLP